MSNIRVVQFFSSEENTEYRLATNVTSMSDEEVCLAYRLRWRIELLWKTLKMHLKLDRIITIPKHAKFDVDMGRRA